MISHASLLPSRLRLAGLALALGTVAASASAQTVIYVNAAATGAGDGSTWADAYVAVQPALDAAQAGDQVWVAAGRYIGCIRLKEGVGLYGGFAGTEDPNGFDLTTRSVAANRTILDGDQAGSVVTGPSGATNACRIDGFTITNGNAISGGGVFLYSSSPLIANNTIISNKARYGGGGLWVISSAATIINNVITGNAAESGGALYCSSCSGATISNNTLTGNSCQRSGALALDNSALVTNSIVAFNSSGVYQLSSGAPPLRNCCVYGNSAYNYSALDHPADPTGTYGNISVDPRLAGSGYGGWHVLPDSPCVGAGSNTYARSTVDPDGQPRIQPAGGTVDIGADEADGSTPSSGPFTIVRVSPLGDDTHDGSSWADAKHSVQAGIKAAAALGGDVWVQAGTYYERIVLSPTVHVYGGFAGTENTRDERDWRTNLTTLDGQRQGTVVTADRGWTQLTLDGFTITNGASENGGGIAITLSAPTITHNAICDNSASSRGGGLSVSWSSAAIVGNRITGNTARSGAGLWFEQSALVISGNAILGNRAANDGGGLSLSTSAATTIIGNTVVGNSAPATGALYVAGTVTIANSIFAFNSSGFGNVCGIPVYRNNCIYGNGPLNNTGYSNPIGTDGNISVDPGLPGWQRGDWHLQPGSPCIDAGNNTDACTSVDLDGQPRILPAAGTVDIGADESDGTSPPALLVVRVCPPGDDAHDGSSWPSAKRTVQAAIDAAAATGGEVWVQAGTYYERINLPRYVHVYGGFAGTETARDQRDWQANVTTLDAQQQGSVVTARDTGYQQSTLDGFTITHGSAADGGGVYVSGASPLITHNSIAENVATSPSGGRGGGVYLSASIALLTDNTIFGNSAAVIGGQGGGGGLYLSSATPVITAITITGNSATAPTGGDGNGGGIYMSLSSPLLTACTISDNVAPSYGGGVYLANCAAKIFRSTLAGNRASYGGALALVESSPTIVNNRIVHNSASFLGGGLLALNQSGGSIGNNTVAANNAPEGGGLAVVNSNPAIRNTIVVFNSSGLYVDYGGSSNVQYSCFFGNTAYDCSRLADLALVRNNLSVDPLFVQNLDPNTPGACGDLHLQAASPCINAGVGSPAGDTTDLDGLPRLVGPTVDMGAYEYPGPFLGDLDNDNDLDASDFALFAPCLAGPEVTVTPGCGAADLDGDSDVDLADFARLQFFAH